MLTSGVASAVNKEARSAGSIAGLAFIMPRKDNKHKIVVDSINELKIIVNRVEPGASLFSRICTCIIPCKILSKPAKPNKRQRSAEECAGKKPQPVYISGTTGTREKTMLNKLNRISKKKNHDTFDVRIFCGLSSAIHAARTSGPNLWVYNTIFIVEL